MPTRSAEGAEDLVVRDLHEVIELGIDRGGHLLSEEEAEVVRRILALSGPAARLYARLTARVPEVFAVDGLGGAGIPEPLDAVAELVGSGLADHEVSWDQRADHCTVPRLAAACARLGLPTRGRRAALVERLRGREGWSDREWLRVLHRPLVRRLERLAFLRVHPDRSTLVVERLGHVRWPSYKLTDHGGLFKNRTALLAWEEVADGLDELDQAACLELLGGELLGPPGGLDLRRRVRSRAVELAREAERAGETADARRTYLALVEGGHVAPGTLAVRVARTLEAEGESTAALAHLERSREASDPVQRRAIGRAGRRIGRAVGTGWAPDPPLRRPRRRDLRLEVAPSEGPRPLWQVGGQASTVERAVVQVLAGVGRRALHAESRLWTTLFALLFAEAYFAPVPGMLPVRHLAGPLDVGTPAFRARRSEVVSAVLRGVEAGEAGARIRAADSRYRGLRLAGASWELASAENLVELADGIGPAGLIRVLERLLDQGWRSARGLPDLAILPGPRIQLAGAFPSWLPETVLFAEVKGPGDHIRDAQAVWHDRLLQAGVAVELWKVAAS